MSLMKDYLNHTRKPEGFLGRVMILGMNFGHAAVSRWGIRQLPKKGPSSILELGCGGGKNIENLLYRWPDAGLYAVDYSQTCVDAARRRNKQLIKSGHCQVFKANVSRMPFFFDGMFELATAFETVYFWPGPLESFREVCRVLRPGGRFLIVNEADGESPEDYKWTEVVDGMKLFPIEEMTGFLKEAGFSQVQVFRKERKHWVAFLATK